MLEVTFELKPEYNRQPWEEPGRERSKGEKTITAKAPRRSAFVCLKQSKKIQ